jgi:hypothetical protein
MSTNTLSATAFSPSPAAMAIRPSRSSSSCRKGAPFANGLGVSATRIRPSLSSRHVSLQESVLAT